MLHLRSMIQVFVYVIAANTVGSAIYTGLFSRDATLSFALLWQIIALAAVCALGNLFFYSKIELSKQRIMIRYIFHYLYINVVILVGGHFFDWIDLSFSFDIFILMLIILFNYGFIILFMFHRDFKLAEDMNRRLRKFRKEER
ncbi:hypothetical protein acsn021_43640 [Anaerocolumna cellulosilytica]|uniref:Uncharacterized protein n=1 Tax=Anaerocolumna cellulosilytica TaxID=433286 RepID=A0A6S6RCV1_9FIRM|nr:DUF3021 family protein [Anaerocolumna cellulosilytica]MBB5195321.1 hypothetical protein [Anaerocolumna cellulosilytica]BCJ96795.1 hypothetical protein acsn021_43640 [Anaerocolumna cellulosilytica]